MAVNPLYRPAGARDRDQAAEMRRYAAAGVCVFCPPTLGGPEQRVIAAFEGWAVTANRFPYAGTRLHLLLVPVVHVANLLDLPPDDRAGMWPALDWVRWRYGLGAYALVARCGDPARTGGTVAHAHVHVIVGDVDDPQHQPVRVKVTERAG